MSAEELAAAAEDLVGTPFRLHGRDPATGLDCIGVLAQALRKIGQPANLPEAYSMRAQVVPGLEAIAKSCGFAPVEGAFAPGDVLFARVGPVQFHLLIAARDCRFVHAQARLRRVVIGELPDSWVIVGHWQLGTDFQG